MGSVLRSEIAKCEKAELVAALVTSASNQLGTDAGGVKFTSDVRAALGICDVLIDFSHPKAAIDAALMMYETSCRTLVTGTTGYSATEEAALEKAANAITLVKSGNFSIGICVLENLVRKAAAALPKDWDAGILDIHHNQKKDAPSGTALMLGRALEAGGQSITPGEIAALRHGGVVGEHSVFLSSNMETLTLTHTAIDRAVFAKGALTAGIWAAEQDNGLYDMRDVLGL
ncbi:MAG: 4-hydroxy-tetrahydrodipicolinate reductase [Robiginitomaculum sp.]|nr:4-hydroxy-tetrahydrodipicolinate reductase [Robiginitomaculum sp.]